MQSKSQTKLKRQVPSVRRPYKIKTKEDFMHWWRKQDTHQKQAAEEQIKQTAHAISRALMVWADDGGAAS